MDNNKMKQLLIERLENDSRNVTYDKDTETLKFENKSTKKGVSVTLSGIVAKWHEEKEKAIDDVVYYVDEALNAMVEQVEMSSQQQNIFPVIRSTSFPEENEEGIKLFFDNHTAETRIYYALDMEKTYRLIDEQTIATENWSKEELREIALFNARSLPTNYKEDMVADNKFYFLNMNDGYDASRILNSNFLKQMEEIITGTMTVAVPHADVLIIADVQNETGYDILAQMTMSFFASGRVPITSLSFLYEDGKLEPIFILGKNRTRK